MLMVAGPNGAGKTTLTTALRGKRIDFGVYVNPDDIAGTLSGSYEERVRKAQALADEQRDRCLKELKSFSFETVMSHPSKIDLLSRAKKLGFKTIMYFVGTDDPSTNIERVAARVQQGGHDVPSNKVVERWARTMENLGRAMEVADTSYIFDNSSIDVGPRLILNVARLEGKLVARHVNAASIPDWAVQHALWPTIDFDE
ncbi:zeta toxin family protein [Bradyrhizobium sp. 156]|uniref:zeta toxin family protein n=1 Tax=Bradyrhizobium sp. 156 TaxID=2782630 RepID=UPI001FF80143|nr:zeta toxin family protein [Bradyrhizobium sp. 156]MCK1326694.1 zeta toxin family protein [Bradyrhizobium sp. 156]